MVKKVLLGILALFILLQFWPVDRSPPPVTGEIQVPQDVKAVLVESCYDCHSSETVWPWYGYVAPVSIFLSHHVQEGREHLDFSNWDAYDADRADHKLEEVAEMVDEGEMPLKSYLLLHGDARLTPDEVMLILTWVEEARAAGG